MPSFAHSTLADLAHLVANGADSTRIAARASAVWSLVEAALAPIIGHRGFAALFKRSLLLASAAHVPLAGVVDKAGTPECLIALRTALEQQSSANAVAAHGALLQTFCDLLSVLIGESLTERLLQPVQDHLSSDGTARERSP